MTTSLLPPAAQQARLHGQMRPTAMRGMRWRQQSNPPQGPMGRHSDGRTRSHPENSKERQGSPKARPKAAGRSARTKAPDQRLAPPLFGEAGWKPGRSGADDRPSIPGVPGSSGARQSAPCLRGHRWMRGDAGGATGTGGACRAAHVLPASYPAGRKPGATGWRRVFRPARTPHGLGPRSAGRACQWS